MLFITRNGLGIGTGPRMRTAGPVVIVVAILASSNYLINDNFGIPGVSLLNDFAGHLPWAEALSAHNSPFKLIQPGYPLGCFALAGTLGKLPGISVLSAFQGILIATPVLIAVTTIALFEQLGVIMRVLAATTVSLAYLITSALVEGAFKEPIEALFLVAIALLLQEIAHGPEQRSRAAAIPIAVLMAGSVANYSYPGLAWPILMILFWVALEGFRRWRTISWSVIGRVVMAAFFGAITLVVLSLPEVVRFRAFEEGQVATIKTQTGNVPTMLPWRETLGIWFSDTFQLWQTQSLNLQHALLIFALAIFAFGVIQAWTRRESGILALLGATLVVALYTRDTATAYNGAKALMVLSCAAVLVSMRGLLPTGSLAPGKYRNRKAVYLAGPAIAVVFAATCLWSDGLALRGSRVGPSTHTHELAQLDRMLTGHTVLFLAQDDFAGWELRGTHLAYLTPYDIPSLPISFRTGKSFVVGEPADFNTVTTRTLNSFSYVVTTKSDFASVPPPSWRPVASTRFYQVWEKVRFTAPYSMPPGGTSPGAVLHCSTHVGRRLNETPGTALVTAPPVLLDGGSWQGPLLAREPGVSVLQAGAEVAQQVVLPAGRWQLSLQYTSSTPLSVRTQGFNSSLPAALEHQGQYWPAGVFTSTGGTRTIQVVVHAPPFLATSRSALLGDIAFVRVDVAPKLVPLHAACGRYVDWYN